MGGSLHSLRPSRPMKVCRASLTCLGLDAAIFVIPIIARVFSINAASFAVIRRRATNAPRATRFSRGAIGRRRLKQVEPPTFFRTISGQAATRPALPSSARGDVESGCLTQQVHKPPLRRGSGSFALQLRKIHRRRSRGLAILRQIEQPNEKQRFGAGRLRRHDARPRRRAPAPSSPRTSRRTG